MTSMKFKNDKNFTYSLLMNGYKAITPYLPTPICFLEELLYIFKKVLQKKKKESCLFKVLFS